LRADVRFAACLRVELLDFLAGAFLAVLLRDDADFFAGLVLRELDLRGRRDSDVDFLALRELPLEPELELELPLELLVDLRADEPELEPRPEDDLALRPEGELERPDCDFAAAFVGRERRDDVLPLDPDSRLLDPDALLRADRSDVDFRGLDDFLGPELSEDAFRVVPRADLRAGELSFELELAELGLDDRFRGRRPAWSSTAASAPPSPLSSGLSSPEPPESSDSSSSGPFTTSPSRISPRHEPVGSFFIITNRRKFLRSSRVRRPAARHRFPVFSTNPLG
jgi:hypothetical protein